MGEISVYNRNIYCGHYRMIIVICDAFDKSNTGCDMIEFSIKLVFSYCYRELFKRYDDTTSSYLDVINFILTVHDIKHVESKSYQLYSKYLQSPSIRPTKSENWKIFLSRHSLIYFLRTSRLPLKVVDKLNVINFTVLVSMLAEMLRLHLSVQQLYFLLSCTLY